jgi:hypothetical protein
VPDVAPSSPNRRNSTALDPGAASATVDSVLSGQIEPVAAVGTSLPVAADVVQPAVGEAPTILTRTSEVATPVLDEAVRLAEPVLPTPADLVTTSDLPTVTALTTTAGLATATDLPSLVTELLAPVTRAETGLPSLVTDLTAPVTPTVTVLPQQPARSAPSSSAVSSGGAGGAAPRSSGPAARLSGSGADPSGSRSGTISSSRGSGGLALQVAQQRNATSENTASNPAVASRRSSQPTGGPEHPLPVGLSLAPLATAHPVETPAGSRGVSTIITLPGRSAALPLHNPSDPSPLAPLPGPAHTASDGGSGSGSSGIPGVLAALSAVVLLTRYLVRAGLERRPTWRSVLPAVSPA